MTFVAGIDLGTQSTKVVVYDIENKKIVSVTQSPHDIIATDDGTREQKAEWWLTAAERCFDGIPKEIKKDIAAVGISGQQHGFVPVSADGEVLYNVKLWNDTSTVAECDQIHSAVGGELAAVNIAGNPIMPGYTAPKVLWLKNHQPDQFAKLQMIMLPHDYLNYCLTGEFTMEYGDASGTGFLDVRKREWSTEILSAIDQDKDMLGLLPRFTPAEKPVGQASTPFAAKLGLNSSALVSSGGGDNMMGAIGTGAVQDGVMTMSLGTSGTLYGYADKPIVPKLAEFAAFCSSTGGWLPLVCTMNCTAATELVRDLFSIEVKDFDQLIDRSTPGAGGMISLPFFSGERTPNLPLSKGCLFGMTPTNFKRENLARATVESTVFGLKTGLEQMQQAGIQSTEIRVIGGGSNSKQWLQIVADVCNSNVCVPKEQEAAAYGAAMQALWCYYNEKVGKTAIADLLTDHVSLKEDKTVVPNAENVQSYEEHYANYLRHLELVKPFYS